MKKSKLLYQFMEVLFNPNTDLRLLKQSIYEFKNNQKALTRKPYQQVQYDEESINLHELITQYFSPPIIGIPSEFYTATELKNIIEFESGVEITNMKKFGMACKRCLGKSKSKKMNGVSLSRYQVARLPRLNISSPPPRAPYAPF